MVVIGVFPKRMADDRLVCMKWVDERKTTSDKGVKVLWWVGTISSQYSKLAILKAWPTHATDQSACCTPQQHLVLL